MALKQYEIEINNQKYDVFVESKYQRGIYYRFRNGAFYVTCPYLVSKQRVMDGLIKFAPKLLKSANKESKKEYLFEEHFIYLFGELFKLEISDKFEIKENAVFTKNTADLEKNLRKLLVNYLNTSVRKYEEMMGVKKPYQISVKKMKSRYGSNSMKTHRLHFQLDLVHYSYPIIDSVVVHELAHEFYRNHQRGFYRCVLEYCPEYYSLKKKLRNKVHS